MKKLVIINIILLFILLFNETPHASVKDTILLDSIPNDTTLVLKNNSTNNNCKKLYNGHIIIYHNGHWYDLLGRLIY